MSIDPLTTFDQQQIVRKIWLTGYIHALESMDPVAACEAANRAISIYVEKWGLLTEEERESLAAFQQEE
ncbi:MAG: hypothetical protein WA956_12170 [Stenotrophomonas sp.]